jgi:hypothetical protein
MTDSILRREKIAAKLMEITAEAVDDSATPDEIFEALEIVFTFWIGHVEDREGVIRTIEKNLPHMLDAANEFAALAEHHGDLQ